jgi:hypothetical protein
MVMSNYYSSLTLIFNLGCNFATSEVTCLGGLELSLKGWQKAGPTDSQSSMQCRAISLVENHTPIRRQQGVLP